MSLGDRDVAGPCWSAVDRGFGGVMVRVLASSAVDREFGGVMVRVLASSAVDRGFEPQSGWTKDYENGYLVFLG